MSAAFARAAGLTCVHPRPYRATTMHDKANSDGLVDLGETRAWVSCQDGPNQLWFTDITYIEDVDRLGVFGRNYRRLFPQGRRLVGGQSDAHEFGHRRVEDGSGTTAAGSRRCFNTF